eukprot:1897169-Alexandrium_andersonii.AAC.1
MGPRADQQWATAMSILKRCGSRPRCMRNQSKSLSSPSMGVSWNRRSSSDMAASVRVSGRAGGRVGGPVGGWAGGWGGLVLHLYLCVRASVRVR